MIKETRNILSDLRSIYVILYIYTYLLNANEVYIKSHTCSRMYLKNKLTKQVET